jgi:hypothetical protein
MQFGVPASGCMYRVLLAPFVVPEGLDIRVVRIYADFDDIDPRTGQSPGMTAAWFLQSGCVRKASRFSFSGRAFDAICVSRCQGHYGGDDANVGINELAPQAPALPTSASTTSPLSRDKTNPDP